MRKYLNRIAASGSTVEVIEPIILPVPVVTRIEETSFTPFDPDQIFYDLQLDELHNDIVYVYNFSDLPPSNLNETSQQLPLFLLRSGQHSLVADFIVVDQVGLLEIDQVTGYNLLHHLARSYHFAPMDSLLEWLAVKSDVIDYNGIVNKKSNNQQGGDTPLHLAVTHPNSIFAYLMIDLLLRSGADPRIPNTAGKTSFDLAASHPDTDRLLVLNREKEIHAFERGYLACAFNDRDPPEDPVNWLMNGSTDLFKINPRGVPYFDIVARKE